MAQICMHSAESSISFGTLIFYCVHRGRLTILHTLLPTKAIKWKKMYNFIQGTKRDCWFCTMHTLLCQIFNLWSRVLKESVQFYGLVGKCVQIHQSFFGTFILYCVQQKRLLILHTHLPTKPLFYIVYSKRDCCFCTHFNLQSHEVKCMKLYIIFHYSTSRTDDFAQKCMKSAKSSISFGYTKRDCWFCTHIYLQSLYFILCTAKEIVDSAHILSDHFSEPQPSPKLP